MQDALRFGRAWIAFAGSVLVVAVLYWAQAVLVPVALAILLTFLLNPIVTPLQRRIGRVPAVLAVVVLTFSVLGLAGWATTRQLSLVIQELPAYRQNIRQKIRDVRSAGNEGPVGSLQRAIDDIRAEIAPAGGEGTTAQPVVVQDEAMWRFPAALGPMLEPLATAGLVVVLVVFMLLERQDLRDRLIQLFGHGRLTVTTRAFDEAGRRVSRYLLIQSLVNLAFGVGVGIGLWAIGVPYPVLWAFLGAALRFIPYVGPWAAAIAPILVALAVLQGWTRPLLVVGLYLGLELFTNLVLETIFYAGAAGISQVGLLVAVAFWTWLWGPLGLLMATPLTVCLTVVGRHVPGLHLLTTLISDAPVLDTTVRVYQRLLAGDPNEATEIVEEHLKGDAPGSVYETLLLPALTYAERDRLEGRLSLDEERAVVALAAELVDETAALVAGAGEPPAEATPGDGVRVLACPANSEADTVALRLLTYTLGTAPVVLEVVSRPLPSSELLRLARERGCVAVCIADLPPGPPSRSRLLAKRLRAAAPDLTLLVGRWAPPELRDETTDALREAGADHVGASLEETADELRRLAALPTRPAVRMRG